MFLSKKYKLLIVFLLILFIQACSFSTKKSTNFTNTVSQNTSSLRDSSSSGEVLVLKDNTLSEKAYYNDGADNTLFTTSDINSRIPIFLLSGPINSFTSIYGQYLCDSLNNDFSNHKYVAITQPLNKPQVAANFLRKDNLTVDKNIPFVADFLITRTDYLLEKVKSNSGPLKDQPTLDVVMFLNGNYLFLWGSNKYGAIEFSDFVKKFNLHNPNTSLVIAVTNNFAKELLTKVILVNKWDTNIEFVLLDDVENLKKRDLEEYELIAYAGPMIHNDVMKSLQDYSKQFIPLTISEDIILNVQKTNPEISSADITSYYSKGDLISIAMLNKSEHKNQANISDEIASEFDDLQKEQVCKTEDEKIPFVNTSKYSQNYDESVFGKSKFNFNIRPVEKILEIEDKTVNINNIKIRSLGIRNVLVATRNTNVSKVFDLAEAFFTKYDKVKSNYITPDMRFFTIKDLITGNLYNNNLKYHYGILNYNAYAKNNTYKVISKEGDLPLIISSNLTPINYPAFFGPELPTSQEVDVINSSYKENLIYRRQEEVLKGLQIIIDSLKKDLTADTSKQELEYDLNNNGTKQYIKQQYNIKLNPGLSITDSNFNDDLNYLPFINLD